MFIFKKEAPKDFADIESGIHIKNSRYYSIAKDDLSIGHFYCTGNQSVGILQDTKICILLRKPTLLNSLYEIRNLNNGALVGDLSISNFVATKSLKTTIEIIHQDPYCWEVLDNSSGFSLITSKTWSKLSTRIYNNREEASLMWDYKSDEVYRYKLGDLPVTGKIEMTNPKNHFLLFVGLFLMEMELQRGAGD